MGVQKNQVQSGMTHNVSSMVYPCTYVIVELLYINAAVISVQSSPYTYYKYIDYRLLIYIPELLLKIYSMAYVYKFLLPKCSAASASNKRANFIITRYIRT